MTGFKVAEIVQALAAAQAETGDYERAIATAQLARNLAKEAGQAQRVSQLDRQLAAYQQKRPLYGD